MPIILSPENLCLNSTPSFSIREAVIKDKKRTTAALKKCLEEQQQLKEKIEQCKEEIFIGRAEQRPDLIQFSKERIAKIIHLSFDLAKTKAIEQKQHNALIILNKLYTQLVPTSTMSDSFMTRTRIRTNIGIGANTYPDKISANRPISLRRVTSLSLDNRQEEIPLYWKNTLYYPQLGRMLRTEDIGQRIIRVIPKKLGSCYDWSFVPQHDAGESFLSFYKAKKLINISGEKLFFEEFSFPVINDECWCTLDEFLAFRKQNPESCMPLHQVENFLNSKKMQKVEITTQKRHQESISAKLRSSPHVPEHSGCVDYSFHPPTEESIPSEMTHRSPNFSSDDPYEVLGLDPNEKNLNLINKRYKTLALLYHPDKPNGDAEKFKKLVKAHGKLLNKCSPQPFESRKKDDFSIQLADALHYFDRLQEGFQTQGVLSKQQIKEIIPLLEYFLKILHELPSKKKEEFSNHDPLILLYMNLKKSVASLLNFYQIKQQLLNMELPAQSLNVEIRMDQIRHHMSTIRLIDLQCEYWNYKMLNHLTDLYLSVIDKYVALARSYGELLLYSEHDQNQYQDIKDLVASFIASSKEALAKQTMKLLWDDIYFKNKMQKGCISKTNFSQSSHEITSSSNGLEPDKENSSHLDGAGIPENALTIYMKQKTQIAPFTLEKEIKALQKNIETNHSALKATL